MWKSTNMMLKIKKIQVKKKVTEDKKQAEEKAK